MQTFVYILLGLFGIILLVIAIKKMNAQKQKNEYNESPSVEFKVETSKSKISEEDRKEMETLEAKYPKWYGSENIKGICFKSAHFEPLPNNETETVAYKSDRFVDLFGRGKGVSYFPGYGKIYNREYELWYQETGQKEQKGLITYKDIGTEKYPPFFTDSYTENYEINNRLQNAKGYIALFNVRDNKLKRTWYAGLKSIEFTGIITEPEQE